MTRLFLLFYVGVLVVLFLAWYLHGVVLQRRADADWARVVEQAHRGGARLVARELNAAPTASREQQLLQIRQRFDYPVRVVPVAELPNSIQRRISRGDDVAAFRSDESPGVVVAVLAGGSEVVRLGPFPNYGLKQIEESLGGWMRLTAVKFENASQDQRETTLEQLRQRSSVAIEIIDRNDLPATSKQRIERGEDIVFFDQGGNESSRWFAATPLEQGTEVIRFGPFPNFEQIEQKVAATTLALVLFPAALAIALLLRPVARQLRHVEHAAKSIAAGDLSARVDQRRVRSAKPLAQAFNDMAGRTESMLRTQQELLQAVSHELRTPLSRIHFAIDLIRDAQDADQRESRLNSLDTAAQELDELVGELLRYVRLETSELPPEIEELPLRPLVDELVEKHSFLNPDKSFATSELLKGDSLVITANRADWDRALGNIIANAGRFAKTRVEISVRATADAVVLDVDDDGPGIDVADRERVFDPFVRLGESDKGVGLGLALVRRIIANHGGTVTILDSPLGGCRIRTSWPHGR